NTIVKKYACTIDVHDNDRDINVNNGIKALLSLYSLSKRKIEENFNDFWNNSLNLSEKELEIFHKIMGYDYKMIEIIKTDNDYPGFLTQDIEVNNQLYDPKIIIAYFWEFCNNYQEEKLHDLLFRGFLKCYQYQDVKKNSHWYCVCNAGKLQYITVSVLQGRILIDNKPLMVDDLDEFENIQPENIERTPAEIFE